MYSHNAKRKKWHDKHCIKILQLRTKQKEYKRFKGINEFKRNQKVNEERKNRQKNKPNRIKKPAPSIFSFKNNIEETSIFMNDIINTRDTATTPTSIYIDSSKVEKLDVDALMYLIAIMNDTYHNRDGNVIFEGNIPHNKVAMDIFDKSGFAKYVMYKRNRVVPKTDNIQICDGKIQDSSKVKEICQYIHKNSHLSRIDTLPLYELIVELMNNTIHHAYGDDYKTEYSKNSWYLFSEKMGNRIIFVFLDTGLGIPKTVYKKWHERMKPYAKDSDYIKSALLGTFRTETQQKNRGKGLPQILKSCQSGLISNAFVYAGNGCCEINEQANDGIKAYDIKNKINGTLFSWEINI